MHSRHFSLSSLNLRHFQKQLTFTLYLTTAGQNKCTKMLTIRSCSTKTGYRRVLTRRDPRGTKIGLRSSVIRSILYVSAKWSFLYADVAATKTRSRRVYPFGIRFSTGNLKSKFSWWNVNGILRFQMLRQPLKEGMQLELYLNAELAEQRHIRNHHLEHSLNASMDHLGSLIPVNQARCETATSL